MKINIKKIDMHGIKISSIIHGLYDILFTLYLFSHLALGWDERFVVARHMITFLLLGLSFFMFYIQIRQNRGLLKMDYVHVWAAGYFISCIVSCAGTPVIFSSLKTSFAILMGLCLLIGVNERYKDREDFWILLNCMVISAFLSGFFILYESGFALSYARLGATENSNNIINSLSYFCAVGAVMNLPFLKKFI